MAVTNEQNKSQYGFGPINNNNKNDDTKEAKENDDNDNDNDIDDELNEEKFLNYVDSTVNIENIA